MPRELHLLLMARRKCLLQTLSQLIVPAEELEAVDPSAVDPRYKDLFLGEADSLHDRMDPNEAVRLIRNLNEDIHKEHGELVRGRTLVHQLQNGTADPWDRDIPVSTLEENVKRQERLVNFRIKQIQRIVHRAGGASSSLTRCVMLL